MKVRDRMTENPKTIDLNASVTDAFTLMKENNFRRLPVMDKGQLIGIITLGDLNQAAPSMATSLSIHELNYLLARTTIKDVLPPDQKVVTIGPDVYIETAAKIMRKHTISGLPVMENGKLVGMVTETDIFDAFIDILGVKSAHTRIDCYIAERPGTLGEITNLFGGKGMNIINTVVFYDERKQQYKLILRVEELHCDEVLAELKRRGYEVESVIVYQEDLS
ncbi:MAG TPA: CBS and ACT domain-containing protein [Syntrophomonadaceae bacterium]|nr:CBS and ACT domain-containing protein [Syntrophomonadaceae bacterium]